MHEGAFEAAKEALSAGKSDVFPNPIPEQLTLPLMSFGGSGILANCVALAILLRVDWENRQLMRGAKL